MEPDNLATAEHFLDNIAGDDLTTVTDEIAYAQAQATVAMVKTLRELATTADDLRRVVFANVPNAGEIDGSQQDVI
ncbi:hypothetical protein [Mycolicibacterium nivoides]|uniref:Uncharacterized protein n=1 Tax=Mycolicibacterium nivoides TaxID=2487344 RepID=A0ABW9L8X7_9MYCO